MSEWTIRPWRAGDEEGQVALFNRVFSEGNPRFEPRSVEVWRHLYLRNPRGQQTLVAEDEDGQIVANYSSLPVTIALDGRRRTATQVVDSCVDARFRRRLSRQGLFVSIAMAYQQAFCDNTRTEYDEFIYGLPNENAYPIGTRLLGYTPVHAPMPRLAAEPPPLAALSAAAAGLHAAEEGWEALPELAALFERHLPEWPLANVRDVPYLQWRYRDWPLGRYRLVVARDGGRALGAALFRAGVGWEERPVLAVVDWFGAGDERTCAALLAAALAAAPGFARLETWVTPPLPHHASLQRLGLHAEPTRFNLCQVLFSRDVDLAWVKRHWCFTMGDSDIY